jgi:outer membrane lipoprotein-sorting protein
MNSLKQMKQLITIFLIFIYGILSAQDAEAKKLLDEVTAKVKSYKNIEIDFKYQIYNAKENINQESKGIVKMEGNKYHLTFMGNTVIFDGIHTHTITPEDEEVTISKTDDSDPNAITPNKMLTFFNKGYRFKMDIVQNVKGRKIQFIKLIPISSKDTRKEILIGIDTALKQIYNVIEVDKKGTKTTLTVNSFKTNQTFLKNQFTFDKSKYKDYYINRID